MNAKIPNEYLILAGMLLFMAAYALLLTNQ